MLRASLLLVVLWGSSLFICADELPEDCEAAVDAADRLAADTNKHCDYSKTGLNGVLHKAFAGKEAAAEPSAKVAGDTAAKTNLRQAPAREFDSAQQLGAVRFELLQLAAKECPAGFALTEERYLPAAAKRLTLELSYRCL